MFSYRRNANLIKFCKYKSLYDDYMPEGMLHKLYEKLGPLRRDELYELLIELVSAQSEEALEKNSIFNLLSQVLMMETPFLSLNRTIRYKIYPAIAESLTETNIAIPSEELSIPKNLYEFQFPKNQIIINNLGEKQYLCAMWLGKYIEPPEIRRQAVRDLGSHEAIQIISQLQPVAFPDEPGINHTIRLRVKPGKTLEETVLAATQAPVVHTAQKTSNISVFKLEDVDAHQAMTLSRLAIGSLFIALSGDEDLVKPIGRRDNWFTVGKDFQKLVSRKAHLRRGHMHWVPYGPGRSLRKLRFYHPCLVQAHEYQFPDFEPPESFQPTTKRRIRDTQMSRNLKRKYNFTCQICDLRLSAVDGRGYAEGAHVIPFGRPHQGPDHQDNLLVLCPNHHTEFDMGAITIDPYTLRTVHINQDNPWHDKEINFLHDVDIESLWHHIRRFERENEFNPRTNPHFY
jgi:hypothetical protein